MATRSAYKVPIRTLYITPIQPDMYDDIKSYFEQFGKIISVEIRAEKQLHYGLVEFELAEIAAAVLSSDMHHIMHRDFKVIKPPQDDDDRIDSLLRSLLWEDLEYIKNMDIDKATIGQADESVQLDRKAKVVLFTKFDIPIRTLHFAPCNVDMSDQIVCYYQRFGEVQSVEVFPENYGFVEFKTVETATTVLSKKVHHIGDSAVQVRVAEPWHQPDHILNALNNDCLRMILSHLNSLDLARVANVCVQLDQLAKSVFSAAKYKHLDLTKCKSGEEEIALSTFGSLAESIQIKGDAALSMINQHCSVMLKELSLTSFRSIKSTDSFPSSLEKLYLNQCALSQRRGNVLDACGELKLLHLRKCSIAGNTLKQFYRLEELRLAEVKGFDDILLNAFITMNPTLKSVSVGQIQNIIPSKFILSIVKHLPHLLELELNMNVGPSERLVFLKCICVLCKLSLRVLKLNLCGLPAEALSHYLKTKSTPIEHLKLSNGIIDSETIKNISQMKELKVLYLNGMEGLTDADMIVLANGLGSQMEELRLERATASKLTLNGLKNMLLYATKLKLLTLGSSEFTINLNDYETILSILQERRENVKLSLMLTGAAGRIHVPEEVQLQNKGIFWINV